MNDQVGKDDKLCPDCAEVIKLAARVCKHCGHRLSQEELENPQRPVTEAERKKQERHLYRLDKALRFASMQLDAEGLKNAEVERYRIEEMAESYELLPSDLLARAKFHGMTIGDAPPPVPRKDWDPELLAAIDSEIHARVSNGIISRDDFIAINSSFDIYGLDDRILELGFGYMTYDGKLMDARARQEEEKQRRLDEARIEQLSAAVDASLGSPRRRAAVGPDDQYGVLQGAANVVGGCATMWGYVILFFIVAAIIGLIGSMLS